LHASELHPELVLSGYAQGVFPMGEDDGTIAWFSPDPRCIFEFERFHIPKSLRPKLNRGYFEVRINTDFDQVIRACADRPEGTWITDDIVRVYTALHEHGFAHSVECWRADELAGGLYGVSLGGAFFGESMFHQETDASKVALVALMQRLQSRRFSLVDTQWITPHLAKFGAVEIPREQYLTLLAIAIKTQTDFV
jgi:leucyl/phenylalanyl-tRNA--protein transferase